MKKKEIISTRSKTVSELKDLAATKKEELAKVRTDITITREKNLKKAKNLRKEISQLLTIAKEKELTEANKE